MKRLILTVTLFVSACVTAEAQRTATKLPAAQPDEVRKICVSPKELKLRKYPLEARAKIDPQYQFYIVKQADGLKSIIISGFEDGCLRHFTDERTYINSIRGVRSLLFEIPLYVGFSQVETWSREQYARGIDVSDFIYVEDYGEGSSGSFSRILVFGPDGLAVGALKNERKDLKYVHGSVSVFER